MAAKSSKSVPDSTITGEVVKNITNRPVVDYVPDEVVNSEIEEVKVQIPKLKEIKVSDMEEACVMLMRALPDFAVTGITMAAKNQNLPLWMEVCGLLMADFQAGTLYSPNIDPSWHGANPILQEETECPECQKIFKPKRRGQKYCCNECGSIAILKSQRTQA